MTNPSLTIRSLKARPVIVPMERPIRTAVGTIPAAPLVLIDLMTDQGVPGRAYIFGYAPMALAPLVRLLSDMEPHLQGKLVAPIERMRDFARMFRLLGRQGLVGMALSGIDMALWDAQGRALGVPVARLLGGDAAPVPAYDSFGIVDPAADRKAIEASLDRGFRAIKIKIGGSDLERDKATVAAVRDIVGEDVTLMVDYNQSLTAVDAIRRIGALACYDLAWVEEPVPAEDIRSQTRVRAASPIAIQTGENWWSPAEMATAIEAGASDLAMPDLMRIGGITGWLAAMGYAEGAGIPVSSHAFVEASAHALSVTPTAHWLEFLDKACMLLTEPAIVENGAVVPRGPGLGMDWDEAAVNRCLQ